MFAATFNATTGFLTAIVNGTVYSVNKTHVNYDKLLEAYKTSNADEFVKWFNFTKEELKVTAVLAQVVNSGLQFVNDQLVYNGKVLHNSYVGRIVRARDAGFPIDPMVKFFENLLQNPSQRSVEELPDFLENKNLPITEDGCFLAYKTLKSDWYSKASGTLTLLQGKSDERGYIYNAVGETIECVRNEVDDERSHECSKGLHVGGLAYSGPGGWYNSVGDKVVICKINPKDVVSVPKDHNAQKVRVCKYEVISEYVEPLNDHHVNVDATLEPLMVEDDLPLRTVTLDNVTRLDTVTFDYKGKNDSWYYQRYMIIDEVGDDYLFGILLPEDDHYEEGNETRKFMKANIKNLEYFDSLEDDFEDEDDENDGW